MKIDKINITKKLNKLCKEPLHSYFSITAEGTLRVSSDPPLATDSFAILHGGQLYSGGLLKINASVDSEQDEKGTPICVETPKRLLVFGKDAAEYITAEKACSEGVRFALIAVLPKEIFLIFVDSALSAGFHRLILRNDEENLACAKLLFSVFLKAFTAQIEGGDSEGGGYTNG